MSDDMERRLTAVEERLNGLRDLMTQQLAATKEASEMISKSNSRHFEDLNHSHRQALEDRTQFVRREVCDARHCSNDKWRESVAKELSKIEGRVRHGEPIA